MELQKIKNDLKMVINFIDWIHISNKFRESKIQTINQVEEVQSYKTLELMGTKLNMIWKK